MALAHSPKIVTDGLVLCLDAANPKSYPGTGTAWTDLSGNGNDATLVNGPVYNSADGGYIDFDGTNDYASLPNNVTDLSGDWAISVWMKPNSDSNPRVVTLITTLDNLQVGYMETTLKPYIRLDNSVVSSTQSLVAATWVNVVYQSSSSVRQVYINAVETTVTSGGISANGERSAIGGGYTGFDMNGDISLGAVYSRALTDQEIQQNFNATKSRYGV